MKNIQNTGLLLFLLSLVFFISLIFLGKYEVTSVLLDKIVKENGIKSEIFIEDIKANVVGHGSRIKLLHLKYLNGTTLPLCLGLSNFIATVSDDLFPSVTLVLSR